MVLVLIAITIICVLITIVNQQQHAEATQPKKDGNRSVLTRGIHLMLIVMIGMMGLLVWLNSQAPATPDAPAPTVSPETGLLFFVVSIALGGLGLLLTFSTHVRLIFERYIVRSNGTTRRYSPYSPVHTVAILLAIFGTVNVVGNFVLAGGTEGLAESFTEDGLAPSDLLLNMVIYVAVALAGVGLFVRRGIKRTLLRLGFRLPQKKGFLRWLLQGSKHLILGAIIGFGLFWVQAAMGIVWQLTASPETIAEQTAASEALFAAFSGSLWLGFLLALTAGVGEELLFRGGLQPIFGNLLTSLFFVVLHSQYLLTPATLIIFVVSLVFGLVRDRYTTPAAMMAHFVYNFTPFVLLSILEPFMALTA